MESSKIRTSGFELLRIVSMLMITFHHLSMTFGLDSGDLFTRLWAQFFYIGGKIGVNCFVMIGSYFLYGKSFKIERIIKLHQQIVIYGVACLLIGIAFIPDTIGLKTIVKAIFPISFSHYWFITIYIGMLCFALILNFLIDNLSYKQHSFLILVCLLLFSVVPTLTTQVPYNDNLSWFCFLYVVAAYFKKYNTKIKVLLGKPFIAVAMWGGIFCSSLVMTLLEGNIPFLSEGINFFSGMYILPEVICTFSIFVIFAQMTFKSTIVNAIGRHTLACYLIQSNYVLLYFRVKLLDSVFTTTNHLLYPLVAVIVTVMVFACSIMLDVIREQLQNLRPIKALAEVETTIFNKMLCKIEKAIEGNRYE